MVGHAQQVKIEGFFVVARSTSDELGWMDSQVVMAFVTHIRTCNHPGVVGLFLKGHAWVCVCVRGCVRVQPCLY